MTSQENKFYRQILSSWSSEEHFREKAMGQNIFLQKFFHENFVEVVQQS